MRQFVSLVMPEGDDVERPFGGVIAEGILGEMDGGRMAGLLEEKDRFEDGFGLASELEVAIGVGLYVESTVQPRGGIRYR
jgi:hypothetical protein